MRSSLSSQVTICSSFSKISILIFQANYVRSYVNLKLGLFLGPLYIDLLFGSEIQNVLMKFLHSICFKIWVFFFIDGLSVYLMNCTSNPINCEKHRIVGYPTLVLFRRISLEKQQSCLLSNATFTHIRLDYHGHMEVDTHLDFFNAMTLVCFGLPSVLIYLHIYQGCRTAYLKGLCCH